MRNLLHQIGLFVAVGCAASATHWAIAVGCVEAFGMAPLTANLAGWLVAFVVAFSGHHNFTFRHAAVPWAMAARRFFFVSAAGITINQIAYAGLLHATSIPYDVLLGVVLAGMAMVTFVISRLWAFRDEARA
ncbi:GtrA family protein [Bordetella sp. 02P26C-1]|uniref:GtrA family protein n=1 Tax=Bordetella sp. 02P26C-1 TaxID=2683195 RepID=UPI001355E912|nr:GtrA family protein [Bordetella sp. 02P26C-1]MVW79189.1 GtrA family protein [Bordetella sp. 02P26C-1]